MGSSHVLAATVASLAEPSPTAPRGCLGWVRALCGAPPSIPTATAFEPPAAPSEPPSHSFFYKPSLLRFPSLPALPAIGLGLGLELHYDSDDDEDIAEALLEEEGGDFPRARKRHDATLRWRHHHGIDDILDAGETPTPAAFAHILRIWPRWLQGRTRDGDLVLYEELGKLRGSSLREARLTPRAWSRHLGLVCEYVVQCVDQSDGSFSDDEYDQDDLHNDISTLGEGGISIGEEGGVEGLEELKEEEEEATQTKSTKPPKPPRNNWHDVYAQGPPCPRITLVLSFAGVTSAAFFADFAIRKVVRMWGHTLQAHYPGLVHRILLVNVPTSLSPAALALLQPLRLLPQHWRSKTWLVLDDDAEGAAKPMEDSHRALLAWAGLSPTTSVLRGIDSIIDSSNLSAAVCPTLGKNFGKGTDAAEWAPLQRLVRGNFRPEMGKEGEEGRRTDEGNQQ